jgi:hypothetical protein
MEIPKLIDEIKGKVYFVCLKNKEQVKELWYKTDSGFQFPIPLSDTEGAEFPSEDKALVYMRWIRKRIEVLNKGEYNAD